MLRELFMLTSCVQTVYNIAMKIEIKRKPSRKELDAATVAEAEQNLIDSVGAVPYLEFLQQNGYEEKITDKKFSEAQHKIAEARKELATLHKKKKFKPFAKISLALSDEEILARYGQNLPSQKMLKKDNAKNK
jgi:hypothetical protein